MKCLLVLNDGVKMGIPAAEVKAALYQMQFLLYGLKI